MNEKIPKGHLFIISGPSGVGKSTLVKAVRERFPDIRYSVSYTTRGKRRDEIEGIHYHFTDEPTFKRMIEKNQWAEWAKVHGNYYGTSNEILMENLGGGHDVLLEIDVEGTLQIIKRYPESVTIFIMPPSHEELKKRLQKRATDDPEVIERRFREAEKEMLASHLYRYVIFNDDLKDAIETLIRTVGKYKSA